MTRSRGFWNLFASRYAKQAVGDQPSYEYKLDQTQALMRPDMAVFEFGCGTGTTALIHAPHVAHIDAIDYSPNMVEIANGKLGATQNVTFSESTLDDWRAADDSYDMVLGMSILHLLPDRDIALNHAYRLLKPGGYLVTSTVCLGDMGGLVKWLLPIGSTLRLIPNLVHFDGEDLARSMVSAGFDIRQSWRPPNGGDSVFHICQKPDQA